MRISRPPAQALRPFVTTVWAVDERETPRGNCERVLPTGAIHVAFRLSDTPLRLLDVPGMTSSHAIGHAIVGGARSTFYLRDVSLPVRSVGAQLRPGAAALLFGASAAAFAEKHTRIDDLWGRAAEEARLRLVEAGSLDSQLRAFEDLLVSRLPHPDAIHPAVAEALALLARRSDVGEAVRRSGCSHRRFIQLFRDAVGLPPKLFARVTRFQRALALLAASPRPSLARVALEAGYSDQPHFNREFRDLGGASPGTYRELAPAASHHVPVVAILAAQPRRGAHLP